MATYEIELDIQLVYRTTITANSKEEALEKAEREAYEDSWCTKMSWGGSKVYGCEEVEDYDSEAHEDWQPYYQSEEKYYNLQLKYTTCPRDEWCIQ